VAIVGNFPLTRVELGQNNNYAYPKCTSQSSFICLTFLQSSLKERCLSFNLQCTLLHLQIPLFALRLLSNAKAWGGGVIGCRGATKGLKS